MKTLMGILCIGCMCTFAACNSSSTNTDSVDSAKDANDSMMMDSNSMNSADTSNTTAMSAAPVSQEDADWAVEAANGGMAEVEMGKLAQQKATNERLKNFGSMMVSDHSKAGDQLKQIATRKNITLPASLSDKEQKHLDELNKKSGKDFDKEYIDMMVDDHKKDVDKFKKGSNDLKDPDLKNFAAQTLPIIQMHLDSIRAIGGKK
jgi:putative membrane protein